jgi:hypothetical protein
MVLLLTIPIYGRNLSPAQLTWRPTARSSNCVNHSVEKKFAFPSKMQKISLALLLIINPQNVLHTVHTGGAKHY